MATSGPTSHARTVWPVASTHMSAVCEGIGYERIGSSARIRIDRPAKRNAFTNVMWDGLADAVGMAEADLDVLCIVVESTGDTFSGGADLEEVRAAAGDADAGEANRDHVRRAFLALRDSNKPTIAAVRGFCVGGGLMVATACDLRVADTSARFGCTPAKIGMIYLYEPTAVLVELVGASEAKRILFTARQFDAAESLRMGLVNELVAPDLLDETVEVLVRDVCATSQFSVRSMKRTIALAAGGQRNESPSTLSAFREALENEDHREGTAAILEKRPAQFTWRG
jgi:enoyl-CoA hydratase/carnithine racemase